MNARSSKVEMLLLPQAENEEDDDEADDDEAFTANFPLHLFVYFTLLF